MEPLLVSCPSPEDYWNWIFQLQQVRKRPNTTTIQVFEGPVCGVFTAIQCHQMPIGAFIGLGEIDGISVKLLCFLSV